MPERIFFDLDGTLTDPRLRLYTLFRELAPEFSLSFAEYWELKRRQFTQQDLLAQLHYTPQAIAQFKRDWMARVEEVHRLEADTVIAGAQATLESIHGQATLYVVTARQDAQRADKQLQALGLRGYFERVLVTRQAQSKAALVRQALTPTATDIFVGDTCEDIQTGKKLGTRTIAVCSGAMDAPQLRTGKPDLILPSIAPTHWRCP